MQPIPEIIKKRHSTREFTKQAVDYELLKTLVESARFAPSACNLQLTEFIILDDEKIIKELADNVDKKFTWAPNFIVVIYDPRFTKHRLAGVQSAGMAVENLLLTAESLGLGACPMAGFENDAKLKDILNIPRFYEVALVIAIGHPREGIEKTQERRNLEEICYRNRYNGEQLKESADINDWNIEDIINYRKRIAPVYLYKNHHYLGSFNPEITKRAAEKFEIDVMKNQMKLFGESDEKNKTVLDLFTYDGDFLREIIKTSKSLNLDYKFIASDYLSYILDVHKGENSEIEKKLIDESNRVDLPNESVDIITCVNKFNFTPNMEVIIAEMNRILRPGGVIFVISFEVSGLGMILPGKKNENVYERNPFYKIGPKQAIDEKDMRRLLGGTSGPLSGTNGLSRNNFYFVISKKP